MKPNPNPWSTHVDRTIPRALAVGWVAALLLLIALPQPAFSEGEDLEGSGIQWVDGWAAGQVQAAKDGKLIFLYFGRHAPR